MNDEWLTTTQAVELSGYSRAYLRRLLRAGKVKGLHFGSVWQVSLPDLEAFNQKQLVRTDRRSGSRSARIARSAKVQLASGEALERRAKWASLLAAELEHADNGQGDARVAGNSPDDQNDPNQKIEP